MPNSFFDQDAAEKDTPGSHTAPGPDAAQPGLAPTADTELHDTVDDALDGVSNDAPLWPGRLESGALGDGLVDGSGSDIFSTPLADADVWAGVRAMTTRDSSDVGDLVAGPEPYRDRSFLLTEGATTSDGPRFGVGAVAALLVVVALLASMLGANVAHAFWTTTSQQSAQGSQGPAPGTYIAGAGISAKDMAVAAKVSPGVVDINTTLGYSQGQAAGTGVVLQSDGVILTNNHVISGATSISVTDVGNQRTYAAHVVGYDRTHDIAVLRLVDAKGLASVRMSTQKPSVGQSVVAVGNAGGAGGYPSVASGTITAVEQEVTASEATTGSSETLHGLLQTNAAIEPGDSGGPLVDSSGTVVGINTAASSGYALGGASTGAAGFAIPATTAAAVAHAILTGSHTSTLHLGETGILGVESKVSTTGGPASVVIVGVVPGLPAAKAGIVAGDTIVSLDGHALASSSDMLDYVLSKRPGDSIVVKWTTASGQTRVSPVVLVAGPAA